MNERKYNNFAAERYKYIQKAMLIPKKTGGTYKVDSATLYNANAYLYLGNIADAAVDIDFHGYPELNMFYPLIHMYYRENRHGEKKHYTHYVLYKAYGDLYSTLMKEYNTHVNEIANLRDRLKKEDTLESQNTLRKVDRLITSIYANHNHIPELTANIIKGLNITESMSSTKYKNEVAKKLDVRGYEINEVTPTDMDSRLSKTYNVVRPNYNSYYQTNLSFIKNFQYKDNKNLPLEYRIATMGCFTDNVPGTSPGFGLWLDVQKKMVERDDNDEKEQKTTKKITHVYFNNLKRDQNWSYAIFRNIPGPFPPMTGIFYMINYLIGYERNVFEAPLTKALEKLETDKENLAVITLPFDDGLMDKNLLKSHDKRRNTITQKDAISTILAITKGTSREFIQDFHISDRIKNELYSSKENETQILTRLIHTSFEEMGLDNTSLLSQTEFQAVYFHMMKYELPNFILVTLNPESFNMTCKDAIDRGAVASAYYNLMKSIELGHPLTKDEFEKALQVAAVSVKARGVNFHVQRIWNSMYFYSIAHGQEATSTNNSNWMRQWVIDNAPIYSPIYKLKKFISPPSSFLSTTQTQAEIDIAQKILQGMTNNITPQFDNSERNTLQNNPQLKSIARDLGLNIEVSGETLLMSFPPPN